MSENFNSDKAKRLKVNSEKGASLVAEKKAVEEEIKTIGELQASDTTDIEQQVSSLQKTLEQLKEKPIELPQEHDGNIDLIAKYENELNAPVEQSTTQENLTASKNALSYEIECLQKDYAKKDIIENSKTRIKQLEEQQATMNREIAELERREFLLKNFEFAKNERYESEINKMFGFVRFTLFKKQVDGQIVPDCECMANGVPYSTQNKAMQIGMGIDIIGAISRKEGIYAPIWIDNRESVTSIPEIKAQVINLVVSPNEPVLRKL